VILLCASGRAGAEHLPITRFGSEHGLASDAVRCALQDQQGYIWFGTGAGLSRFDGQGFRSYAGKGELEGAFVLSLLEEPGGTLLAGTQRGLYRFDPSRGGSFSRIRSEPFTGRYGVYLLRDRAGAVWAAANGLYRLEREASGSDLLRRVSFAHPEQDTEIKALAEGRDGALWVASFGLYRYARDESSAVECTRSEGGPEWINTVGLDGDGRILAMAGERDLLAVEESGGGCTYRRFSRPPALIASRFLSAPDGSLWTGPQVAQLRMPEGIVRRITREEGLHDMGGWPLMFDRAGNLWIGSDVAGVVRVAREGFASFGPSDGIEEPRPAGIMTTRSGELVVVGSNHVLQKLEGSRFVSVKPLLPDRMDGTGWGWSQYEMQDRDGRWWIPTGVGIARFAATGRLEDLARSRPQAIYTEADGLPSNQVFRLFEDSRGDVWVSTFWPDSRRRRPTLSRWDRLTGKFQAYGKRDGVTEEVVPTAFLQSGEDLWIGYYEGRVYRYRRGSFHQLFVSQTDPRAGIISALRRDRKGRIWIVTGNHGVRRVDLPDVEEPAFISLSTREGLTTNLVNDVAEDDQGRIYLATDHGVDVLQDDRVVRHLDVEDGLPARQVIIARWIPGSGVWFGTMNGPARLDASNRYPAAPAPRVRIAGLRVSGVSRPLSALGEARVTDLVLSPEERRLQIDYLALTGDLTGATRFQHRLSTDDPWSEPTTDRSVLLPDLAPGRYRFEVRGVDGAGTLSPEPAVVTFRVLAPVWRRSWFLALLGLSLAAAVVAIYRARVAHLIALERQRTGIAMDLHDEMGSGLGSIGVLADLAADDSLEAAKRRELLDQVATTASELGASMSDIVASLRPGAGSLESLGRHLSERGRRMFPGAGARLEVRFPDAWPDVRLTPAVRHQVALIGLEALHNAAQHAEARGVTLELGPAGGSRWLLSIRDDGRGLDVGGSALEGPGLGLESMRRRAQRIGAQLEVTSSEREGTRVALVFDPDEIERRPPRGSAPRLI